MSIGEETKEARRESVRREEVEEAERKTEVGGVRVREERRVRVEKRKEVVLRGGVMEGRIMGGGAAAIRAIAKEGGGGSCGSGERKEAGGAVGGERRVVERECKRC